MIRLAGPKRGSDGLVIQADVRRRNKSSPVGKVEAEFAKLDIFVSNARTDLPTFYQKPLEITPEQWTWPWTRRPKRSNRAREAPADE